MNTQPDMRIEGVVNPLEAGQPTAAPERRIARIGTALINPGTSNVDERLVEELTASIMTDGLLAPIGVDKELNLIFGRHRLEVYRRKLKEVETLRQQGKEKEALSLNARFSAIACVQFLSPMTVGERELFTLVENLCRKYIDTGSKQSMIARLIVLRHEIGSWATEEISTDRANSKLQAISTNGANSKLQAVSANGANSKEQAVSTDRATRRGGPKADPWFSDLLKRANLPERTGLNWWHEWRIEAGKPELVAGKATKADQLAFAAWLQRRSEAEAVGTKAKADAALAEAQKQQKLLDEAAAKLEAEVERIMAVYAEVSPEAIKEAAKRWHLAEYPNGRVAWITKRGLGDDRDAAPRAEGREPGEGGVR